MKLTLLVLLLGFSVSGYTKEVTCKTEFNLARFKKNFWGNSVRISQNKMLHDLSVETFTVALPVNEDGSAYFGSSAHLTSNQRLDTYYKTIQDSHKNTRISLLFTSQGQELTSEREIVLNGNRHSETVELDEPYLLEQDGKKQIKIESISFSCQPSVHSPY